MTPGTPLSTRNLDRTFLGGLAWTAGGKWATQIVTWGSVVIVARLLSPADFGLAELAGIVGVLANVLAEFGIGNSVVQMRELTDEALAQLNSVSLLLSTLSFGLVLACLPAITWFFRSDELGPVVAVNSLALLMMGVRAVPTGVLRRDLKYKRLAMIDAWQGVTQAIATVVCAFVGLGYWSLVIGMLAGSLVAAAIAVSSAKVPFRRPQLPVVREALRFGYHTSVSQLAGTLNAQAASVVIGRQLGEALLGQYRMAMNLAFVPADKLGNLIMRVTAPLFSTVQSDLALMRRYFLAFAELLSLAVFPASVGICLVAPELVEFVLGSKWAPAAVGIQWLSIYAAVRMLMILGTQILLPLRESKFLMVRSLMVLAFLPLAFYVGSWWGLAGVGAAWFIAVPVSGIPSFIVISKKIGLTAGDLARAVGPSILACLVMAAVVWLTRGWAAHQFDSNLLRLLLYSALGAVSYLAVYGLLFRSRIDRILRFARNVRTKSPVDVQV